MQNWSPYTKSSSISAAKFSSAVPWRRGNLCPRWTNFGCIAMQIGNVRVRMGFHKIARRWQFKLHTFVPADSCCTPSCAQPTAHDTKVYCKEVQPDFDKNLNRVPVDMVSNPNNPINLYGNSEIVTAWEITGK